MSEIFLPHQGNAMDFCSKLFCLHFDGLKSKLPVVSDFWIDGKERRSFLC